MDIRIRSSQMLAMFAAVMGVLVSGCGVVHFLRDGVGYPMTPEQSKAQVVDAAREIVKAWHLHMVEAFFWRASCNDQGDPPFRGVMRIAYPRAASFEESDTQIAKMADSLQSIGWTGDPGFHSHGTVLKKNNVVAVLGPQNVSLPHRDVELYGECRDVTTTKNTKGSPEPIAFS